MLKVHRSGDNVSGSGPSGVYYRKLLVGGPKYGCLEQNRRISLTPDFGARIFQIIYPMLKLRNGTE